jgi:hypothetical protein
MHNLCPFSYDIANLQSKMFQSLYQYEVMNNGFSCQPHALGFLHKYILSLESGVGKKRLMCQKQ